MFSLMIKGTTGPIVRDLLRMMAEMAEPRWPKHGPGFFQYIVGRSDVIVSTDALPVHQALREWYRNGIGVSTVADGCVTGVTVL